MSEKRILVLDGNSSQCLPLIRSFYKEGHSVTLICPSIFSSGYFSRYAHKKIIWPKITGNEEEFYKLFLGHIKSNDYDLVLGLSDVSTAMLAYHKDEIENYVKTVVPEFEVYSLAADKFKTMQCCMDHNIPCPITVDADEADIDKIGEKFTFPVVVKPKKGVGAVGFTVIPDRETLVERLSVLKKNHGSLLIQEYIPNKVQYTAEVFCDHNSEMKACVISEKARFFPVTGGTSSCNVTVESSEMIHLAERLLYELNWTGAANIDFILDPRDNKPKVIEINPRIGATVKIAFAAGIDFSKMFLKLANEKHIEQIMDYTKDVVMRNLLLDILWFLFSSVEEKRLTIPPFYKFSGEKIFYQSFRWDDPGPFIGFFLGYIIKYANINKLKKKLGIK